MSDRAWFRALADHPADLPEVGAANASDFEMSEYCGAMALKDLATRIESQATWDDLS
jgi:hypothetical protein